MPTRGATVQPFASVPVDDDAADQLAVLQVLVALVDLVEPVAAGDELVQLELAVPVQAEQPRYVVERVAHAEDVALDPALVADHPAVGGELDVVLPAAADRGQRDLAALPGDGGGPRDDLGGEHAHRADGVVGQLAPGQVGHRPLRAVRVGERVGGAELHRVLALELHRVDHHDVPGPGVLRALDRVGAHSPGPEDHHGVPGGHSGRVHRCAPAGRDAAAGQRGHLERDVLVHADAGVLRDHGPFGEGAEHAEPAEAGAPVVVEPERAVGHLAGLRLGAEVAQVLVPGRAVPAGAADRDERAHHVVAFGDPGDAGPGRLHHAGTLVAAHHRQPRGGVPGAQVLVGVAHARGGEPDADLAGPRLVKLELGDLPRLAGFPDDRRSGSHVPSAMTIDRLDHSPCRHSAAG